MNPIPKPRITYQGRFGPKAREYLGMQEALAWEIKKEMMYQKVEPFKKYDLVMVKMVLERKGREADGDNIIKFILDSSEQSGLIPNDKKVRKYDVTLSYVNENPSIDLAFYKV